ncbi:hypothetical protein CVT25_001227 [Psilocybe cyanescens]|uniref:Uncharacterized protein n=1 Tax=Psilocybe cyanescens TaxID=93625 RepID=A0A409XKF5_PSICY|nr:hypothetical protein CVT25_001227 [Psilocybe cyanescens]
MSDNNIESSTNNAIRTLAIFFAGTAVGMLSFVEAVFTKREGSPSSEGGVSDDVVVTCLLLSTLFSLSVAALRQPQRNTRVADFALRLSFLTLLAGMMVFTWENQRTITSVVFTVSFILLVIAYSTWTDPSPNSDGEDHLWDRILRADVLKRVQQLQEEFENSGPKAGRGLPRRPLRIAIAGAEYEREILPQSSQSPNKQTKGSSIFYSNEHSDMPYLIFIYDTNEIAEYRLVSLKDTNLPTQMFLRLSQAVLAAHNDGRILGSNLSLGNIIWDVSRGSNGLPHVTFNNLPPPLPPKNVPGLELNLGGRMKDDVRNATTVLLQLVTLVEKIVPERPQLRDGTHEIEYSSLAPQNEAPFPSATPEVPIVIQKNKPLRQIVGKCLSDQRAQRPTAAALCETLLRLCRSSIVRDAALDIGKSVLSKIMRLMP